MHIIFFTDNFPPEGNAIASRVYERAVYWVKWGHSVTVITSVPNFPEGKVYSGYRNKWIQKEIMDGICVVRVKTFIAANKGFFWRILDFISYIFPAMIASFFQKKADVIIATTPQFFVGMTGWLSSVILRKRFILEVADIWPASIVGVGAMKQSKLISLLEKLELFIYRRAQSIIALTPSFKKNLESRGIDGQKISVVINGVDLSRYSPQIKDKVLSDELHLATDQFVVGYIGTHGMAHGLLNVLNTASLINIMPDMKKILFLFVGAGAERDDLMKTAQKMQLSNVKFIPAQDKKKILNFWSLCDLALVHLKNDPVFTEVIPSKIFEAMGMGLPIVLSAPKGEASAIIEKEEIGCWIESEKPDQLANAIKFFYLNQDKRADYAAKSRAAAYLYSREKQARDMLIAIQQGELNWKKA